MTLRDFAVLDAAIAGERLDWLESWQNWTDREIFAHPSFVEMFAQEQDRVICARFKTAQGGVLLPLILRPLAAEPWTESDEEACDAFSPYGYGGAFAWNITDAVADDYWQEYRHWASTNNVVATFLRLSLFPEQCLTFPGEIIPRQSNVVRCLALNPEELWRDYEHKVRKNVNRARQTGIRIEVDLTGLRLSEFLAIYHDTMQRRQARDDYYFPQSFFDTVVRKLNGQWAFFHALQGDNVVSTELVLVSAQHLYSFLGGTRAEFFPERPNDLLKHEVILWGREAGKRAFVLGGGYGEDDGIFRYKRSFAPSGVRTFHIGTWIHDSSAYERLTARRAAWEQSHGRPWEPRPAHFPAYRG